MLHLVLASATSGSTGTILILTTGLTAIGVVLGALVSPLSDFLARRDSLRSYKRNVYRNFLDHAYWYQHPENDSKDRKERAVLYLADWHRIQLIAKPRVQGLIKNIQDPAKFKDDDAENLLRAFKKEIGSKGLSE